MAVVMSPLGAVISIAMYGKLTRLTVPGMSLLPLSVP